MANTYIEGNFKIENFQPGTIMTISIISYKEEGMKNDVWLSWDESGNKTGET